MHIVQAREPRHELVNFVSLFLFRSNVHSFVNCEINPGFSLSCSIKTFGDLNKSPERGDDNKDQNYYAGGASRSVTYFFNALGMIPLAV